MQRRGCDVDGPWRPTHASRYHHTFADELYRLRGPFWWKEAVLPDYDSHPIAADVEDADAESRPTDAARRKTAEKMLCSPTTIYTAMAATM